MLREAKISLLFGRSVCLCIARFATPLNLIIQMQFDRQIFDGLIKSLCKLQPLCAVDYNRVIFTYSTHR